MLGLQSILLQRRTRQRRCHVLLRRAHPDLLLKVSSDEVVRDGAQPHLHDQAHEQHDRRRCVVGEFGIANESQSSD